MNFLKKLLNIVGTPITGKMICLDKIDFEEVFEIIRNEKGEAVALKMKPHRIKISDLIFERVERDQRGEIIKISDIVISKHDILLRIRWFDFIGRAFEGIKSKNQIEIVNII